MKEQISKCEDWFWKAFRGGVYFAANNLNKYYREGDEDIIAPQPEKAKDLYKTGAELGYPLHQSIYADELKKAERYEEALRWYREAAEGGNPNDWFEVGFLYEEGKGTEQDMAYAVSCYQKELARDPDHTGANNYLGRAYFTGKGVPQDYAKAFRHLSIAHDKKGDTWGVFYLAKCCFYGLGTPQDYAKALRFLDKVDWQNREADYMRGVIFARGLGGAAADIPKGVAYLQKAGSFDKAKEELLHYKKTLFGKWVRRD